DLSRVRGRVPPQGCRGTLFRPIRKSRHVTAPGLHAYCWFALQAPAEPRRAVKKRVVPTLQAPARLEVLLDDGQREQLESEILPTYIGTCRWFGSKARTFRELKVVEQLPISTDSNGAQLWFIEISYLDASA